MRAYKEGGKRVGNEGHVRERESKRVRGRGQGAKGNGAVWRQILQFLNNEQRASRSAA